MVVMTLEKMMMMMIGVVNVVMMIEDDKNPAEIRSNTDLRS